MYPREKPGGNVTEAVAVVNVGDVPVSGVLFTTKSGTASEMIRSCTTVPGGMFFASTATVTGPD